MVYEERNVWAGLIVSVVGVAIYTVLVLPRAIGGDPTQVDWVAPMLWTIGLSIVASIVVSTVWGIVAGMRDPDGTNASDQRDRDNGEVDRRDVVFQWDQAPAASATRRSRHAWRP